jgi:hypothetical protein
MEWDEDAGLGMLEQPLDNIKIKNSEIKVTGAVFVAAIVFEADAFVFKTIDLC